MPKLRKAVRIVVGVLLGAWLLLLAFLNLGFTERWIASWLSSALSDYFQTDIAIERVEVGLGGKVVLHHVEMLDQKNKPMLRADLLSASVDILPLIENKVRVRTLALLDADIKLYKERENLPANYQFFIDRLSSAENKEETDTDLSFGSIIVRRTRLAYDDRYEGSSNGQLNLHHLNVEDIDANVSMKVIRSDSLNFRVRHLALKEKSGLNLRKLSFRLSGRPGCLTVNDVNLALPSTLLQAKTLTATYDPSDVMRSLSLTDVPLKVRVRPSDLAFVEPKLRTVNDDFAFTTHLSVSPFSVSLTNLLLNEVGGHLKLDADVRLTRKESEWGGIVASPFRFETDCAWLAETVSDFAGQPLPEMVARIGKASFDGMLEYAFSDDDLRTNGNLIADCGNLKLDLAKQRGHITANASLDHLLTSQLTGRDDLPTDISLTSQLEANLSGQPSGRLNLVVGGMDYRGQHYADLRLQGELAGGRLPFSVMSANPNLDFSVQGAATIQGKELQGIEGSAKVGALAIHNLIELPKGVSNCRLSFNSDFSGRRDSSGKFSADIITDNLIMEGDTAATRVNYLRLQMLPVASGYRARLKSDFLDADIEGPLSQTALVQAARRIANSMVPFEGGGVAQPADANGDWAFNVHLKDIRPAAVWVKLPFDLKGDATLNGHINGGGNNARVTFHADQLSLLGQQLSNVRLYLRGDTSQYDAMLQTNLATSANSTTRVEVDARSTLGKLGVDVVWNDVNHQGFSGSVKSVTDFVRDTTSAASGTMMITQLLPTQVAAGDTIWRVQSGPCRWNSHFLEINDLSLTHLSDGVRIHGRYSSLPSDSIEINLRKMNLEYVFDLLSFHPIDIKGNATGSASLRLLEKSPYVQANLEVEDFSINDGRMGVAQIDGTFDGRAQSIALTADIREPQLSRTLVDGIISIGSDSLDLDIVSENTNLAFLHHYLRGMFTEMQGRATGHTRLWGPFNRLDLDGENMVSIDAVLDVTNVRYSVDSLKAVLAPGIMDFTGGQIADGSGGSGTAAGHISHDKLHDFRYNFEFTANDLCVFLRPQATTSLPIATTAYASGNVSVEGRPGYLDVSMNVRPEARTRFEYTIDTPDDYTGQQFLTFAEASNSSLLSGQQNASDETEVASQPLEITLPAVASSTDINLNMSIDMTPAVPLKVVMNEKTGDNIVCYGSGALRATWHNKGAFNLYGIYQIQDGTYKMSIQDIIRKDFHFQPGSTVVFNGPPFDGKLDLKAVYVVPSASLSDLNVASGLSDNSIRVNCLLNFTGSVLDPLVRFDLDLPTASDDVKQMVRKLISTDEEMNRQILYLLGIGRFYTYDYETIQQASGSQSQSAVAVNSFLSSTLSGQLNDILSNAIGSSNWTFGTNLTTGTYGWRDVEVEGLLSGRMLNNRLLFNGNIGYRDRITETQGSSNNFVGDFNLQYLVTRSGNVRLKAYSETNDRYFTKNILTTQGIGVVFQRDFTSLRDLFRPSDKKKKKQK